MSEIEATAAVKPAFFDRPGVRVESVPVGGGVPLGVEQVRNDRVGVGGAYGTWGSCYDNAALPALVEAQLGYSLGEEGRMSLGDLGFLYRHHVPILPDEEQVELEVHAGARVLSEAAEASGWAPDEVDAVFIGVTTPPSDDYLQRIAARAGIRRDALKVILHKACDGGVGALHLALNPSLVATRLLGRSPAQELRGKKVLVGGIEGLSRVLKDTYDRQALQLFANGAAVFGVVPGQNVRFLVGGESEVYDEEGLLQVRMMYPHSRQRHEGETLIEGSQTGEYSYRLAGLQHEPAPGGGSVVMAGPMGMVKLFVRSGVSAVRGVYRAYRDLMDTWSLPGKDLAVAIAHHANYKINLLKAKQLQKDGFTVPMPWLVHDFGNVSAASAMIAFLRKLPDLAPGDHVMVDGFGAGTYYDVVVMEMGGA